MIEVSAFVSPKWVPQLADAADVFAAIARRSGTRYSALVPNIAGLERATRAGVTDVAIFAGSTETFSLKNINQSIEGSLATYKEVCDRALAAGLFSFPAASLIVLSSAAATLPLAAFVATVRGYSSAIGAASSNPMNSASGMTRSVTMRRTAAASAFTVATLSSRRRRSS